MNHIDQREAARQLEDILSVLPAPIALAPPGGASPPKLGLPPRTFYHKHIDKSRLLRRVRRTDGLFGDLETVASTYLTAMEANRQHTCMPDTDIQDPRRRPLLPVDTVANVAKYYDSGAGATLATLIASNAFVFPTLPTWDWILVWSRVGREGKPDRNLAVDEQHALFILADRNNRLELNDGVEAAISEDMREALQGVVNWAGRPELGVWVVLAQSPAAEALIDGLGDLAGEYTWRTHRTQQFPAMKSPIANAMPQDAAETPWIIRGNNELLLRRSARLSAHVAPVAESGVTHAIPAASRRPKSTAYEYGTLTTHALAQLAWSRAVETDSSIIVFTCGTLERIAIRHRGTQTLYLSEPIKVQSCADPPYTKLQVGIYIALLQDAISRMNEAPPLAIHPARRSSRKRGAPDEGAGSRTKRRKLVKEAPATAISAASERNFMLLYIQHGIYDSPVPTSFIRSAPCLHTAPTAPTPKRTPIKRRYRPDEYFTITLTSTIASGAVGTAHTALLRATWKGDNLAAQEVVVKIAFFAEQQEKMRHEFEVYRRLAEHGVKGVPEVYGIFDDLEGGAIAMVMSNCGECLWTLRPDPSDFDLPVTSRQCTRFLKILDGIHAAGVRHRDLRPENLMLTKSGEAFIIDFDLAEFEPSKGAKKRERRALELLLYNAEYPDPAVPSAKSSSESESGEPDTTSDGPQPGSD
ncbi:Protein kinase domain-containing protein [Mycena kentingensis (nom. inval.)]|nr:Protein kinase domain-containing protein [Mycena kentingensis (nom. inval.)]